MSSPALVHRDALVLTLPNPRTSTIDRLTPLNSAADGRGVHLQPTAVTGAPSLTLSPRLSPPPSLSLALSSSATPRPQVCCPRLLPLSQSERCLPPESQQCLRCWRHTRPHLVRGWARPCWDLVGMVSTHSRHRCHSRGHQHESLLASHCSSVGALHVCLADNRCLACLEPPVTS